MEKLKDTLNDLKLTDEEVNRLSEAFKKEEFKKLFREYAEELQDPENKKKYEEELTAMENERGMDIEFINPISGHVLKTIQNSEKKVFINICQSEKIEKPSVNKTTKDNIRGATWSIPHSFSPPREDIDKKNESCLVYDVVFNINAYQMGSKNIRFRKMLHDTALEGIEKMFKVTLDKINYKILKLKMKGVPVSTVIRKKRSDFNDKQSGIKNQENDPLKFPYPEVNETTKTQFTINESNESDRKLNEFTKPTYKIKYSNDFEMLNYVGDQVEPSMKPKRMIIEIKLPLVSSAKSIDLDIESRNMKLTTIKPIKYLLELKLSYPVLSDMGSAKFDKSTKILKLDLPIEQTGDKSENMCETLPSNFTNNLITEQPSNDNEIKEEFLEDKIVLNDTVEENAENNEKINNESSQNENYITKKIMSFEEIERIIPDIELKFRNNSTYAFIVCFIRNIDSENWNFRWELISPTRQQVIIAFSNCGQGGWKNLYKIPLIVDFKNEIMNIKSQVQCLIAEGSMVIQLPIQINSQRAESVTFRNQNFICKYDDPFNYWNYLDNCEIVAENNNNDETFQTAFGIINKETLKIICAPLEFSINIENEFPKIYENIVEIDSKENDIEIIQGEIEKSKEIMEISEIMKINTNLISITDKNVEKDSSKNVQDNNPTILSSDDFEVKRSLEHRNNCCIELNSDLLFDLE